MIKGIGKQVVVLKNTGSELFEEAIFILKEGVSARKDDMIAECRRIISLSEAGRKSAVGFRGRKAILIVTGLLTAASVVFSTVLFFVL